MTEELQQCYNKGCGKKFNPKDNTAESCRYHPGGPVFHDALKGWSCCKKRSTDFSEFLSFPGCTVGFHSNVKPAEAEKPTNGDSVICPPAAQEVVRKPVQPMARPSADEPLVRLQVNVADSLRQALEKQMKEMSVSDGAGETNKDTGEIQKGTSCKNNSCTAVYEGEHSNKETCRYHPGVPVFHEGMKYWSCCERKTTDFNTFLSQAGCADGKHLWIKKEEEGGEKKVACRYDWHQTGSFVTLSVFAKLAQPLKTCVEVNKVTAKVKIVFDGGKSQFEKFFVLNGIIDPAQSSVKMLGTKVEVNLKKLEPGSWSSLELPLPPPAGSAS